MVPEEGEYDGGGPRSGGHHWVPRHIQGRDRVPIVTV